MELDQNDPRIDTINFYDMASGAVAMVNSQTV
jgi:hypothetical protein